MKKIEAGRSTFFVRTVCLLMAVLMIFSLSSVAVFADEESENVANSVVNANENKKREINVVFDNSGSMYMESRSKEQIDRWCYAKYAMEAFVATLNNNDTLRVYPMNNITTTGRTSPSTDPILINGKDKSAGIEKIRNMYSEEQNGETPFTPVEKAADGFTDANSVKYLVVITDGNFQPDIPQTSETLPTEEVRASLESIQARGIEVLFLRIGDKNVIDANISYRKGVNDTSDIISAVNDVCNRVFQRIELDDDYIDDGTLDLRISMSKIVVFAQGGNAKAGVIRLPGGTNINPISSEHIKYSDKSSADGGKVEKNLNGYVATYSIPGGTIAAGKYDIDAAGDIAVFYEPAIDVKYTLKDPISGNEVVPNEKNEISAGDYIIEMQFVDSVTGEDVTEHELLDGDKDNVLTARLLDKDGNQIGEKIENGKTITLSESDCSYIEVTGTYLDDYTITNNGKSNFGPLKIKKNPFKVSLDISNNYFCTTEEKSWDSFVVSFTVDGKPATKEEFAKIELAKENVKIEENDIDFDVIRDEETCTYKIKFKLKNGKATDATYGSGTITVTPTYDVGGGEKIDDSAKTKFSINMMPLWAKILLISGIILGVIILIVIILTRKVYPKALWIEVDDMQNKVSISRGSVIVAPAGSFDSIMLSLKPTMNVFEHYFLKKNKVGIVGFMPSSNIDSFNFGNYSFQKNPDNSWPDECNKLKKPSNLAVGKTSFGWSTYDDFCSGSVSLKK